MTTQETTLALLADFDDPDVSELDLAKRHGLSLDQLHAAVNAPPFQHALSRLRDIRAVRQPLLRARAEARAAEVLTNLTARDPTTASAAKEIRLALKDLLKLLASPAHAGEVARRSRDGGGLGSADGSGRSKATASLSPPSPSGPKAGTAKSPRSRFKPRPKRVSR